MGQPQVHAQLVQTGIGLGQPLAARGSAARLRLVQLRGDVQRRCQQAAGHRRAERTRERFSFRHKPRQEIEHARQYNQIFRHASSF